MKGTQAIKQYFEQEPNGRKVETKELLACSKEERAELGKLACEALGVEYDAPVQK